MLMILVLGQKVFVFEFLIRIPCLQKARLSISNGILRFDDGTIRRVLHKMKAKKPTIWEKLQSPEPSEWTTDEVKTAIHWFRQLLSFLCGLIWGCVPLTGFYSALAQLVLNTIGTFFFYTTVMKIDPEEFGGHGVLTQEAISPSISMFLLIWIITFSIMQY